MVSLVEAEIVTPITALAKDQKLNKKTILQLMWCRRRQQRQQQQPPLSRIRQRQGRTNRRQQQQHRDRSAWKFIQGAKWRELYALLRGDCFASQDFPHQKRRYLPAAHTKLPMLSYSLWNGAPVVILQAFLERYPSAIYDTDSQGRLPLHVACICQRSPSIIDLLLEQVRNSRSAAILQDRRGNVPLHYAMQAAIAQAQSVKDDHNHNRISSSTRTDENTMDILTSLLAACPQAAIIPNDVKETAVTLSQQLPDPVARKVIYTMLVRTQKTLAVGAVAATMRHHHHHVQPNSSLFLSEDFTAPSSSHFWDATEPSSLFLADATASELFFGRDKNNNNNNNAADNDDYDDDNNEQLHMIELNEHQAVGERPKRRNGMVVVSTVGSAV